MKAETQLLKAAVNAREELGMFLACCSAKEVNQSYVGFDQAWKRLNRAIDRIRKAKRNE